MPVPPPDTRLDPRSITSRGDLASVLTALRERAGLTVRDVARRSGVPVATVGGYFSGRHVPPVSATEQVIALLDVCGVPVEDHPAWLDAVARARRAPGRRATVGPVPYRGLAAFQPEDAEWFFGREALTRMLVEKATASGTRLPLVVVGASGAGKSSVLRAGLVPAISGAAVDAGTGAAALLTPGASPMAALAAALPAVAPGASAPAARPAAVVVDQLEEIFTAGAHGAERRRFTEALGRLAAEGVPVVLGLRADFYGEALRVPALLAWLQENQVVVGAMSAAELRRAIVEPARRAGVDVEDALVEAVLADLQSHGGGAHADRPYDAGSLPMLSHALWATWERGARRTLTVADYRAAGGIEGAVATTAERVVRELEPAEQDRARRLLLRLVHVAEDTADTRRRVPRDALVSGPEDADLLERFVDARLVTVDASHAQIAHEALLVAWPRLRGWIDADRAGLRTHRRLADAAITWDGAGRDPDLLYRGASLETARSWTASAVSQAELRPVERAFLEASAAHEAAENRSRRRRTQQLRRLVAVLAALLVVAASLGVVAFQQGTEARREADVALSRQIAMASDDLRGTDPAVSAQLAMVAYDVHPTVEARSSLLSATAEPPVARLLQADGAQQAVAVSPDGSFVATAGADTWVRVVALGGGLIGEPLDGGDGTVFALALSPDGRVLAAGGGDAVVRLWDVSDPASPTTLGEPLAGPASTVYALAFSPDGRTVAAGSADGSVHLWDLDSPVDGHRALPAGTVQAVAFAADGRALTAGTREGAVVVWPLTGTEPGPPVSLEGPAGAVYSVAVSPDGASLVAGTSDGSIFRWDLDDPAAPAPLGVAYPGPTTWINGLAFSDDGSVLAAGGSDDGVWQWDAETGAAHGRLEHAVAVTAVAFVPGSHDLVSASNDGVVRAWTGQRRSVPASSSATLFSVAFAAGGERLASASREGVQLWRMDQARGPVALGPPLVGDDDVPLTGAAAVSADGSTVAAGDRSGTVHLWDVAEDGTASGRAASPVHADVVESVALSGDGTVLASGSDDATAAIRDLAAASDASILEGATNYVYAVGLSPDARTLAVGSVDESVYLWDVSDPSAPRLLTDPLTGPDGYVGGVTFSPDGTVLAVGSDDATVWLWDVGDPSAPELLAGPVEWADGTVWILGFTPDGRYLAAASADGTARVWDVSEPHEPQRYAALSGATGRLFSLAVSPDGSTVATGGDDAVLRLYDIDVAAARERLCAADRGGLGITPKEWAKYVPDAPYEAPCG